MKKLFLIIISLVSCSKSFDIKQSIAHHDPVVIGIIGNSIACGYDAKKARGQIVLQPSGLMTQESQNNINIKGWSQMLGAWLKAKNPKSIVWNLSGSGWTIQNHLDRNTVGLMASMKPKPSIVFLPLQVNDRYKGIDINRFKVNTELLIKAIQDNGMIPVLVKEMNEPLPRGGWAVAEYYPNDPHPNAWADYMAIIDSLGTKYGVDIIDTYTPSLRDPKKVHAYVYKGSQAPFDYDYSLMDVNEPWGFNGIHPNQKGHNLIFLQYTKWLSGHS